MTLLNGYSFLESEQFAILGVPALKNDVPWQGFISVSPTLVGLTVIFWVDTLNCELPSQAASSNRLMTLEDCRNDPRQPFLSSITANAAIMQR